MSLLFIRSMMGGSEQQKSPINRLIHKLFGILALSEQKFGGTLLIYPTS